MPLTVLNVPISLRVNTVDTMKCLSLATFGSEMKVSIQNLTCFNLSYHYVKFKFMFFVRFATLLLLVGRSYRSKHLAKGHYKLAQSHGMSYAEKQCHGRESIPAGPLGPQSGTLSLY